MRQIPLDIRLPPTPVFDSFVPGANAELVARLKHLAASGEAGNLYLWGEAGCGRSHLLAATQAASRRPVWAGRGQDAPDDFPLPPGGLLIVDELERLSAASQIALFRAINGARELGLAILMAGDAPPIGLPLREDLRTRIGQALIYRIHPLSDEAKADALAHEARSRGLKLPPEVIAYLLRHARRDLGSLLATLHAMDERSLTEKRPATIAMAKEILNNQ